MQDSTPVKQGTPDKIENSGPYRNSQLRDRQDSQSHGPHLEAKEHIGGFWILQCADMDEALAWGRKAVVACRVPVEVRAFLKIRPNRKSLSHRPSREELNHMLNLPE